MDTTTGPADPSLWKRPAADGQLGFLLIMLAAGYLSIAVSQIALGIALGFMLYRWFGRRERPPVTGLEKTAGLLFLWALIMIPFSTNQGQSLLFFRRFYLFAAIWVAASAATSERRRMLLACFLLGGAVAISFYGQIQHARLAGGFFSQRMDVIFNPMTSGALLVMAFMVAVGFLVAPGLSIRWKTGVGLAALPVLLGIVMTMTRSAQLGLLTGLAVVLLLVSRKWFGIFVVVLMVAVAVLALYGENLMSERMWGRITPQYVLGGENTSTRLDMWRGGWEMIKAHPLTGVGDRGLEEIAPDYYTSAMGLYFGHMHNNVIHMAVIWGIPGMLLGQAFVFAGLWCLVKRWRLLRRRKGGLGREPFAAGWVLGAIGAWVSFTIAGFTEWYFGDAESMLIYLAILGCALGPVAASASAARADADI